MTDTTYPISQGEVERQINALKNYIQTNSQGIGNHLYEAIDGIARTALAYRDHNGQKGWASKAQGADDTPLWSPELAEQLETLTPAAIQSGGALGHGGALGQGNIKLTLDSNLISKQGPPETPTIDEMVESVKSYLASIDAKNRELASLIGPVAYVQSLEQDPSIGPFIPYMPTPVKVPARAIIPMINALLETLRLLVSNTLYDISFLRKILSIVLSIFDVLRGEWRNGVLSFIGVFGQDYMMYGLVGKTFRYVYNFISPDIQNRLETDILDASKSALIGAWLWVISIISPDFVRAQVNDLINKVKESAESINEQITDVEKRAQLTADPLGLTVKFPRFPLDRIPNFDDIQNFQAILRQPEIYCLPPVQQALQGAIQTPALRIALELLSIPVRADKMAEACASKPDSLVETAVQSLQPTVYPKVGGSFSKRQKHNRKGRKTRKTKPTIKRYTRKQKQ